jgi:hypothetical protein
LQFPSIARLLFATIRSDRMVRSKHCAAKLRAVLKPAIGADDVPLPNVRKSSGPRWREGLLPSTTVATDENTEQQNEENERGQRNQITSLVVCHARKAKEQSIHKQEAYASIKRFNRAARQQIDSSTLCRIQQRSARKSCCKTPPSLCAAKIVWRWNSINLGIRLGRLITVQISFA